LRVTTPPYHPTELLFGTSTQLTASLRVTTYHPTELLFEGCMHAAGPMYGT
jgi:hypothetical protein